MSEAIIAGGRWEQRRGAARAIRILAFLLPVVGSVVAGRFVTTMLPSPTSTAWGLVRWVLVAAVSTAALIGIERIARRLIPLSVLFRLSLAFPETVPSRLGLALRIGTTTQLKRRIEAASTAERHETPNEAAHRLLELVGLLSRHDRMTRGHSERVRGYAHIVGTEMGIDGHELEQLRWSALLHDVGKIHVPAAILNKPGRLTDEEFDIVKSHPMAGKECVEPLAEWLGESVRAVWEHHERFDGGGYPQGLSGTDISRSARIVCVVDAYDVMTSTRSYKKPMSGADARAELSRHAGAQFDPVAVRAFLSASIGVPGGLLRRSTGLSHLALFPQAIVRKLGSSMGSVVAIGTAAAVGAVGGTVGIAMAERPMVEPVVSSTTTPTVEATSPRSIERAPAASSDVVDDTVVPRTDPQLPRVPNATTPAASEPPTTPVTIAPPSVTTTTNPSTTTTTRPPPSPPPTTITVRPTTTIVGPVVTIPETTSPEATIPNVTLPNVTLPNVTLPNVTLPNVTLPNVTIPVGTVPIVTVPVVTVPVVTVPIVPAPAVTLPAATVPDLGF